MTFMKRNFPLFEGGSGEQSGEEEGTEGESWEALGRGERAGEF